MKRKFVAFGLCLMLGVSTLAFSACDQNKVYYEVLATSSNMLKAGTTSGSSSNYVAGSTATLVATPFEGHEFLAWIKNQDIVDYNPIYSFVVNSNTAGKYTALFSDTNFDFGKLSSINYDIKNVTPANADLTATKILSWNLSSMQPNGSIYYDLAHFEDAELYINYDTYFNYEEKVFFTKQTYSFKLEINFEYEDIFGIKTSELVTSHFAIDFNKIFGNETNIVNGNTLYNCDAYSLELSNDNASNFVMTLTYKKLESSNSWDAQSKKMSNQTLEIVFSTVMS